MGMAVDRITIRGFKSIENLDRFPLRNLNVLIGANGAGKSNFVDFFRMLRSFAGGGFQKFVGGAGGGDGFCYLGPKFTPQIASCIEFGSGEYRFVLEPTSAGTLQISRETVDIRHAASPVWSGAVLASGSLESGLTIPMQKPSTLPGHPGGETLRKIVLDSVSNWSVYHFHDTSALAPVRRDQALRDFDRFRADASNLAPFLFQLRTTEPGCYDLIRDTIQLVAPFFDDFLFRPVALGSNEVLRLEWQQHGTTFPFQPYQLSDGTLRFICLATALLQPDPPATIVIDEPELGLHPYAIEVLSGLIQSAATRTQVIVSTQSPTLLDHFAPEEIVVVSRDRSRSTFSRLDSQSLNEWLQDYTVGELWKKDVVPGGPVRD